MIKQILLLRCCQSIRLVRSTGPVLIIATLVAFFGIGLTALSRVLSLPSYVAIIAGATIILLIHTRRPDLTFLQGLDKPDNHQVRGLLMIEYILILGPLLITQLYFGHYLIAVALTLIAVLVGYNFNLIGWRSAALRKRSLSFIPIELFELKCHVERSPLFFAVALLISCFGVVHVGFLIVAMFLAVLLLIDAFSYSEPPEMIHWHRRFVLFKVFRTVRYFLLFFIIQIIMTIIIHRDQVVLMLYSIVAVVVLLIMIICYKYSSYHPLYARAGSSQTLTIFILLSIVPGGLLITIPYTIMHYIKANKNMTLYYA